MKKSNGQTAVLLLILIPIILVILAYTLSNGRLIYKRIKMQNAVDGAAYTSALWQARGLNVICDLNWVQVVTEGAEAATLRFSFKGTKAVTRAQDMVARTFPGTGALDGYNNYDRNMGPGGGFASPLGAPGMFSLKVTRYEDKLVPMWMVKDLEKGWGDQSKRGPYSRMLAVAKRERGIFNIGTADFSIPEMTVVAQAMPYRDNTELTQYEFNAGLFDVGGLWDPQFYPKLVPVTAGVPGFNKLLGH